MDVQLVLILFGAGIVGGVMASMVGGASVVTFPVLLAAGLNPVAATASNLVAVSPGNLLAAVMDRSQLPPFNRAFLGLLLASVGGAFVGAVLLLATPARLLETLIPVLLGFATVIFAFSKRITNWLRARALARGGQEPQLSVTSVPVVLLVSVYGGYFGAGVGVLLLGVMSIATRGDYRSANVIKNLITSLNTIVAATYFVAHGAVQWPQTLTMMAGCLVGGFCGSHLARVVPPSVMRVVVVVIGAALTLVYAYEFWVAPSKL